MPLHFVIVLAHGANNIDSSIFTPTELEIAAVRRQLSAEATQAAVSQANVVATAAGLHVAAIRSININTVSENDSFRTNMVQAYNGRVQTESRLSTAAGDNEFAIQANITAAAIR